MKTLEKCKKINILPIYILWIGAPNKIIVGGRTSLMYWKLDRSNVFGNLSNFKTSDLYMAFLQHFSSFIVRSSSELVMTKNPITLHFKYMYFSSQNIYLLFNIFMLHLKPVCYKQ